MKSVDNFNPNIGVKFSTYAVPMIIGEIRRFLRDNSSYRIPRSLRDTAYKAIHARELLSRASFHEPTMEEIAKECGISKEDIIYALDAIQTPLSLYDPVYTDSGDTLYVMDQISDKKNKEENWIEDIALITAMQQLKKKYPELKFIWLPRNTEKDISDFYKKFGKRKTKELIEKAKQTLCLEKQIDVEETITNFK
jgi:RNA polymerase sporulation-specific sigma factor